MNNYAIEVNKVSKKYRLGKKKEQDDTLIKSFLSLLISPYKNFRKIKNLSDFSKDQDDIFTALDNVSFNVEKGEVLGVIGYNGAGKSTLLKILSQITPPSSGNIKIEGRVSSLLEVGTGFHPDLTGEENIFLNGTILGMTADEIKSKLNDIVEFSGISDFIYTPVKRYSSGMRVRLAFSIAAFLEPEILLIDEVLAVGDADFQQKCLGKMEDISKTGRTILFVSHNLDAIAKLTTRCIFLKNGKIYGSGYPHDMIKLYMQNILVPVTNFMNDDHLSKTSLIQLKKISFKNNLKNEKNHEGEFNIYEFEPFEIVIEFKINKQISNFQFGCSISSQTYGTELFTMPSNIEKDNLRKGSYVSSISIDPNHLRNGKYSINFKLFVNLRRIDRLMSVAHFNILPKSKGATKFERWINGPLHFQYKVTSLKKIKN